MNKNKQNIIIYNSSDGKASVSLYAKDGNIWMNQNQLAELFGTSVPNTSMHTSNILKEKELEVNPVVKNYFTTASDGRLDENKQNMALTSWQGAIARTQDIYIAKNYLN